MILILADAPNVPVVWMITKSFVNCFFSESLLPCFTLSLLCCLSDAAMLPWCRSLHPVHGWMMAYSYLLNGIRAKVVALQTWWKIIDVDSSPYFCQSPSRPWLERFSSSKGRNKIKNPILSCSSISITFPCQGINLICGATNLQTKHSSCNNGIWPLVIGLIIDLNVASRDKRSKIITFSSLMDDEL